MRPNSAELLRGIQGTLTTYILPEVQSDYARTELMLVQMLLGIVVQGYDDAAQGLVDGNAALRSLAGEAAQVLNTAPIGASEALAAELEQLSKETDASVRLSELTAANDRLRDAAGRVGVLLQGATSQEHMGLRTAIIEHLQRELARLPHDLMGPRSDG
ncbi:MAG: hypothetical protein IIB22_11690 [Chloroflexi bacterium]|nr:hypothetical protein [Chloroflexota bacterium]